MILQIELTEEQVAQIAGQFTSALASHQTEQFQKPLTVQEFADKTGLSIDSIYRRIKSGKLREIENMGKKLIPASELQKFS